MMVILKNDVLIHGISTCHYMGVSKNNGKTPKSSILIGFSIIKFVHFGDTPIFGSTHM